MGVVELEAAAALYTGAQLEQLGPFRIVDRLVELWLARGLPIGTTAGASSSMDSYWLHRDDRLSDAERREIYSRVFDKRFDELWTELVVALAGVTASSDADTAAGAVRTHLGNRIDETTLGLTPLLYAQLREALDILSDPEILNIHGAQDIWQLIDQRARLDLGAAPDVPRVRTMASSGAAIIAWLPEQGAAVTDEVADAARSWIAAVQAPPRE